MLDYAAGLKLDTIQLSSLDDYETFEPAYLERVKEHAARVGIAIDAGIGCICPSSPSYNKKEGEPAEYVAARAARRPSRGIAGDALLYG